MDAKHKIGGIWHALQGRYGLYPLKDGQSEALLKHSWVQALGKYSQKDLNIAVRDYIDTSAYEKWPTEGKIIELLNARGAKPEVQNALPRDDNQTAAAAWYARWVVGRAPEGSKHPALFDRNITFQAMLQDWWASWPASKNWNNPRFADMLGAYFRDTQGKQFEDWVMGRD